LGNQRLKERRAKAQTCKPRVAKADKGKQGILDTVFTKFVVGGQRVVDMEVRTPYRWVSLLKGEGKRTYALGSTPVDLPSCPSLTREA